MKKPITTRRCPKCGGPLVDPKTIGLTAAWGTLYCPMTMPYSGCGWSQKAKAK